MNDAENVIKKFWDILKFLQYRQHSAYIVFENIFPDSNNLETDQLVNHPPCVKKRTHGLIDTLETIRKMSDGDEKEAKLSSFIAKLSILKSTPELLLIHADALEQFYKSRYA